MIAYIDSITIHHGTRVASVFAPTTGKRHSHGLGAVGEPLRPFLGLRSEGYEIALGDVPPAVFEIDYSGRANSRGFYPKRGLPWAALGAPDVSLADWATDQTTLDREEARLVREHDEAADRHFGTSQN